jgi:hypothetical protein
MIKFEKMFLSLIPTSVLIAIAQFRVVLLSDLEW